MRCRFIIALDTDCYNSIEDAKKYAQDIMDIIWDEVCDLHDPLPKVLNIYEVKG